MSFRSPGGPQPSRVYRRRRILVTLGLLAVIAVIVLIIVRPGVEAAPAAAPSTTPTTPASSAPATAPAAPAPSADTVAACAPGQVEVTAVTDKQSYGRGQSPQLSWAIRNLGAAPCSLNVGTAQQVFTVTSGSDTIWKSTDCQTNPSDAAYTLPPASTGVPPTKSSPLPWDRVRSRRDTCGSADRPMVPGGGASYHLSVSVGGFPSAKSVQFLLD